MTPANPILVALDVSSADEARRRRECDGPNRLPVPAGVPAWRRLLTQLVQFFALMLWVAAGLALVAGMPQLSIAIVAVILLNAGFAFSFLLVGRSELGPFSSDEKQYTPSTQQASQRPTNSPSHGHVSLVQIGHRSTRLHF